MLAASNPDVKYFLTGEGAIVIGSIMAAAAARPTAQSRSLAPIHCDCIVQHSCTVGHARHRVSDVWTQSNKHTSASWVPAALQHTRWDGDRLEDCLADPHLCSQKALRPNTGRCVLVCRHGLHPNE